MKCANCETSLTRTTARGMVSTYAMITHYFCDECYQDDYANLHKASA